MHRHLNAVALGAGLALALSGTVRAEGQLFIYNWFDYTPTELLEKFEQTYDVDVTLDTYDSNETLLAKLKGGGTGYDIADARRLHGRDHDPRGHAGEGRAEQDGELREPRPALGRRLLGPGP